MRLLFLWAVLLAPAAVAQAKPAEVKAVPVQVVPIDKEPSHHLVFENEYVRVFSVEVAPHSETKYHQHDRDYVWVALGDSDVESERLQGSYVGWLPTAPIHITPKDGEAQFTKGGFAHKAVNKSDKPFRNVTVEFKLAIQEESPRIQVTGRGSSDHGGPRFTYMTMVERINLRVTGLVMRQIHETSLSKLHFPAPAGDVRYLIVGLNEVGVIEEASQRSSSLHQGETLWAERRDQPRFQDRGQGIRLVVIMLAIEKSQGVLPKDKH